MNILASYDWLKEYVDLRETPEQFAARVSLSGPGIERLYPQGTELEMIVIGQIISITAHPQADKLAVTRVEIGEKKPLTIVCGGSNLSVGQWVAVAKSGAKVKWHGDGELIELKPTEIRGQKSDGMICSASEIGLFDAFPHTEREIMDLGWVQRMGKKPVFQAGTPLSAVLGVSNDTVMDIEITTNRADAVGMVGLAREASAILKRPFLWKPSRLPNVSKKKDQKTNLSVKIADKKLCPRYLASRVENIHIQPSPWWLKRRLLSAGLRPVNNVVDITNYVMLELGQPLHAFDAEKIVGGLQVRKAKAGEKLSALDGKEYELDETMLIIADSEKPVAVAGVMGGEATSVTPDTRSVVFESANFDPVTVRRTARKLNLYSDAQLRFEKGLSTQAPPDALARALELCTELAGGTITSLVDLQATPYRPLVYKISLDELTALMGVPVPQLDVVSTLKRLGIQVVLKGRVIVATIPWWRDHDIESGRDLVEEVARIYGYMKIPAIFPLGMSPKKMDPELVWEQRVRQFAKGAGMTETYTYSFVSRELLEQGGYSPDHLLRVQNPLSSDYEFMRTTLLPSLLQVVSENRERFPNQRLFEVSHVYYPTSKDWSTLPDERLELGAIFFGQEHAWKEAKGFVESLLQDFGLRDLRWQALTADPFWHPGRSVQVFQGTELLGTVGELHPSIASHYKMEQRIALVDLPLEAIFARARRHKQAEPLPIFPEAKRDIAVVIDRETEVQTVIHHLLNQHTEKLTMQIEWFDTYRGDTLPQDKKSVAFHITLMHPERTLETKEVDDLMQRFAQTLQETFGAEVRS